MKRKPSSARTRKGTSSKPKRVEPLDQEISDVLLTWPSVWTEVDFDQTSALRNDAFADLVSAGLLEARDTYVATFRPPEASENSSVPSEQIQFVIDNRGEGWRSRTIDMLPRICPPHWFDGTTLRGHFQFRRVGVKLRLSGQGESAKADLAGIGEFGVVDFVRRRGRYANRLDTDCLVRVVSSTRLDKPLESSSPPIEQVATSTTEPDRQRVANSADGEFDNVKIDVPRRCVPAQWSESPVWRTSLERVRERFVEAARMPGRLVCLLKNDSVGPSEPKTVTEFTSDGSLVAHVESEPVDHPPRPAWLELPGLRGLPVGSEFRILRHPGTSNGEYAPGVSRDCEFHGDVERWQEYSAIATAAGSCLTGLPKHVTALVWRDWLNGFDLPSDVWLWTNAVFELAWRQIPGSSVKAERFADVLGCQIPLDAIPQLRANVADGKSSSSPEVARELATLPDDPPRWYSLLDDVLNASITAIDLLFAIAGQAAAPPIQQNSATFPPHQPPKNPAGRKRDKGAKATEACQVWVDYERLGLSQQEFCNWWNRDKKVACGGLKWLDRKLSFVRKLMRENRVPDEFTNKLKPLRRVKSATKKSG